MEPLIEKHATEFIQQTQSENTTWNKHVRPQGYKPFPQRTNMSQRLRSVHSPSFPEGESAARASVKSLWFHIHPLT